MVFQMISSESASQFSSQAALAFRQWKKQDACCSLQDIVLADLQSEQDWLPLSEAVDAREEQHFCSASVFSISSGDALASILQACSG